jgi:hypothetical protein
MKIGGSPPFAFLPLAGQEPAASKGGDWPGGRCGFGLEEPAAFDPGPAAGLSRGANLVSLPPGDNLAPRYPEPEPEPAGRPDELPVAAFSVPPGSVSFPSLPAETAPPAVISAVTAMDEWATEPEASAKREPAEIPEPRPPVRTVSLEPEWPTSPDTEPLSPPDPRLAVQPRQDAESHEDPSPRGPAADAGADPAAALHPHRPAVPSGPDDRPLPAGSKPGPVNAGQPAKYPLPHVAAPTAPSPARPETRTPDEASAILPARPEPPADLPEPHFARPEEQGAGEDAFRFDELGVFGLHGGAAGIEMPRAPEPRRPAPPAARPRDPHIAALAASPPPAPPVRPIAPERPLARPDRAALEPGVRLEPHISRPGPSGDETDRDLPDLPSILGEPEQTSVMQPVESAEAAPPEPVRHEAAGTGLHDVAVIERSGQLLVAAMAPPLDGDGRALLRRLVRDILAGRGLSHADFQLNGVPLGTDFQDITGGSHGARAR